jgi:hypothetical protein
LSISYSDLTPDGKVQLAAKAGITLNPQKVVAEEMKKHSDAMAIEDKKNELAHKSIDMKAKEPSKGQGDKE